MIEDVDIARPGYTLPSTITLPAGDGAAPCVVFFAGSGPTDRDWTSPLLPGTNGSGAQLALALQARGVGSIRFDKVGSGVNMPKSTAPADLKMLDVLSLAHYVDEAEAAFDELANRDRLRQDLPARPQRRIDPRVVGGHREAGGPTLRRLHQPVRAVALDPRHGDRADPGDPHQGGSDAAVVDNALEDFRAAMLEPDAPAPDLSALPEAAGLWQATHSPLQQRVARELIFADPLAALHAYRGRALVVSAANDAQVPGSDADRIFAALGSDATDKMRVTIADANHVYKSETRAPSTISPAEIAAGYADEDHALADGLVDAIVGFVTTT